MANEYPTLYVGVDGGGTKCRAICVDDSGNILGEGLAGPGNPLQGEERAKQSIQDSIINALSAAGYPKYPLNQLVVGLGLAGVNMAEGMRMITSWRHPYKRAHVATDIEIAQLAAQSGRDGAIIICGTGSVGYANVDGKVDNVGGQGFPVADIGSGAWYGLEAVKQTLLEIDGAMPKSRVGANVCEQLQTESALEIASLSAAQPSSYFAKLAKTVLRAAEAGDETADEIIAEGVSYIEFVIDRLTAFGAPSIAMIGGLSEPIKPYLSEEHQARVTTPENQPELGSLFLLEREENIQFTSLRS